MTKTYYKPNTEPNLA